MIIYIAKNKLNYHKEKTGFFWNARFADALRRVQERADHKNVYAINPAFDR